MGGAVSNLSATDTAFGYRAAPYMLSAESVWYDPAEADACTTWAREFVGEAEALGIAQGTYLNFSGEPGGELLGAQFGGNLERLRRIKRQYDPDNLFRHNNNIQPA
jgi:FAD/FMN-containing dehydrogenase